MENKKIEVKVENGIKELVIREGEASKVFYPMNLAMESASIDAIRNYIEVMGHDPKKDMVVYNMKTKSILYRPNYKENHQDHITSKLVLNPEIDNVFGINNDQRKFEPLQLAKVLKMNKRHFADKDSLETIIAKLTNFKANVTTEIEKSTDNRGNKTEHVVQKVVSSIPTNLIFNMQIFTGDVKKAFNAEILFDVAGGNTVIYLISSQLAEIIEETAETLLGKEVKYLKSLGLAVIESN